MQCLTCTRTKELTAGAGTVNLGTITSLNTDVYISIEDTSTGKQFRQEATSSATGQVDLDLTQPDAYTFRPNADYDVWVWLQTGDISDAQTITNNLLEYECFKLRFVRTVGGSNTFVTDSSQVVEVV